MDKFSKGSESVNKSAIVSAWGSIWGSLWSASGRDCGCESGSVPASLPSHVCRKYHPGTERTKHCAVSLVNKIKHVFRDKVNVIIHICFS